MEIHRCLKVVIGDKVVYVDVDKDLDKVVDELEVQEDRGTGFCATGDDKVTGSLARRCCAVSGVDDQAEGVV